MGEWWNLRRVMIETRREPGSNESGVPGVVAYGRIHIYEIYYDEQGRPWTYADASLLDKIRMTRDWMRSPVLRYPEDFTGEPDFLKELERLKNEDWTNWEKL